MLTRFVLGLTALLTITSLSFGQITIQSSDFSSVGTSLSFGDVSEATFDVGQSGANQSWTFGNYDYSVRLQRDYINPAQGPHGSLFQSATRAAHTVASNYPNYAQYDYFRIESGGLYYLGSEDNQGNMTVISGTIVPMPLPLVYQASWSSVSIDTVINDPYHLAIDIDSISYSVDSWGTVHTPYGDYPCLREFTDRRLYAYDNGVLTNTIQYLSYTWINQAGNEVITIGRYSDDGNPQFTTGELTMIDVPMAVADTRQPVVREFFLGQNYPNPFNPTTTLPITLDRSGQVSIEIYDMVGRTMFNESIVLSAGSHTMPINAEGWASGNFLVRVSSADEQQTIKMQLIR